MTYFPWLSYAYSPIFIIRLNSVEVRAHPWSHTMSKQLNFELPIVTAEHSLGKSTAVKRKRGRPKKQTEASFARSAELPDMCAVHGFGKSSESITVKRKRGRPKKQTEASFGRSEELPDMCAEHGLEKSSDVERKRIRLGEVLTLQQLLTKGVGWFTIKPSVTVTIAAPGRRRYSYHRCVECGKKGLRDAEGKYSCVDHPEAGHCFRQGCGVNSGCFCQKVQRSRRRRKEESCSGSEWDELLHDRWENSRDIYKLHHREYWTCQIVQLNYNMKTVYIWQERVISASRCTLQTHWNRPWT